MQKLTGLEHEKLLDEYRELLLQIAELLHILRSPERLMDVIREELTAIKTQYNDPRRTEITENTADINIEDLINEENVVVTLSHQGYVKYQPLTDYEAQRRGGKGKSAAKDQKKKTLSIAYWWLITTRYYFVFLKSWSPVLDESLSVTRSEPRCSWSPNYQFITSRAR